ncbi:MAG: MDR family oxidoreductase [Pseudomonadota bacterium]
MSDTFSAIIARERSDGKVRGALETLSLADLPDENVLVDVAYSTLNFKDGLAVSGKGKICRTLPMVCGIDLAGTVAESGDDRFAPGDAVLINGYGLSEVHWGGYTQKQRVNADWLVKIPSGYTAETAMAVGTAGYTAMLSVMALIDHGLKPGDGPIAISGASGGVGSISLLILKQLGYETIAITGRPEENQAHFEALGAAGVAARTDFDRDAKPLEKETFAGAIDSVGAKTLATLLAQTKYEGLVAACGLAGGFTLPATVMPFILRGVTLRGIDSVMARPQRRQRAWDMLSDIIAPDLLSGIYRVEAMSALPQLADALMAGTITGRIVIDTAQ